MGGQRRTTSRRREAWRTFAIAKADQTITFPAISGMCVFDADFNPAASAARLCRSASRWLWRPCAVVAGKVHLTGAGSCTVTACQSRERQLQRGAGWIADVRDRQGRPDDHLRSSCGQVTRRCRFQCQRHCLVGADRGLQQPHDRSLHHADRNNCSYCGRRDVHHQGVQGGNGNYNAASNIDRSFAVTWVFHGFSQPVDNVGWNSGQCHPGEVRSQREPGTEHLRLGLSEGNARHVPVGVDSVDTIEETFAASNSGLQYDSTANPPTGQYIYVWKTDKAWSGTCRRLDVQFIDGQSKSALFQFKK